MDYATLINTQKNFFNSNTTLPISFRIQQLKKLKTLIQQHEKEITAALFLDLRKPEMEAQLTEIMLVKDEIDLLIKKLPKWSKAKSVASPFPIFWPGKSKIYYEPYGSVLIMGPWNYPFLLVMSPLIGAIAAGNCCVVKPSEHSAHTAKLLTKIINENFAPEFVHALNVDAHEAHKILQEKFDYIFFIGGTRIGKIIMESAGRNLTPLTLELGGKSPCIVDASANLDFAARRIVWGKMLNAEQTCIAPDYLLIQRSCKNVFIEKMLQVLKKYFGNNIQESRSFGRIINRQHYDRLTKLLHHEKIIFGGEVDANELYISPTLVNDVTWQYLIM